MERRRRGFGVRVDWRETNEQHTTQKSRMAQSAAIPLVITSIGYNRDLLTDLYRTPVEQCI